MRVNRVAECGSDQTFKNLYNNRITIKKIMEKLTASNKKILGRKCVISLANN